VLFTSHGLIEVSLAFVTTALNCKLDGARMVQLVAVPLMGQEGAVTVTVIGPN
jgi:hypothetical protein